MTEPILDDMKKEEKHEVMDDAGKLIDVELDNLGRVAAKGLREIFDKHPDWTIKDRTAAVWAIQAYLNGIIMNDVIRIIMKKQQEAQQKAAPADTTEKGV